MTASGAHEPLDGVFGTDPHALGVVGEALRRVFSTGRASMDVDLPLPLTPGSATTWGRAELVPIPNGPSCERVAVLYHVAPPLAGTPLLYGVLADLPIGVSLLRAVRDDVGVVEAFTAEYVNPAGGNGPAWTELFDWLAALLADGSVGSRTLVRGRAGAERDFDVHASAVDDDRIMLAFSDVTHRRRLADDLHRTSSFYEAIIDQGHDAILLRAEDGRFTFVSEQIQEMLGYDRFEFVVVRGADLVHPDDRLAAAAFFLEQMADPGAAGLATFRMHHADGSWRWIECSCVNRFDDLAVAAQVICMRDVTERREAEQAAARREASFRRATLEARLDLEEAQRHLLAAFAAMHESFALFRVERDARGMIDSLVIERCRLVTTTEPDEELIGRDIFSMSPEYRTSGICELVDAACASGTTITGDLSFRSGSGVALHHSVRVSPVGSTRVIVTGQPVTNELTERRARERAEHFLNRAIETMHDGFGVFRVVRDPRGAVDRLDIEVLKLITRPGEETAFVGRDLFEMMPELRTEAFVERVEATMASGRTLDALLDFRLTGNRFFRSSTRMARIDDDHIVVNWHERTPEDVMRAEQRVTEARLVRTFEAAGIGLAFVDAAGALFAANHAFCELVGRSETDLVGRRLADLLGVDLQPSTGDVEASVLRPDGRRVVLLAGLDVVDPGGAERGSEHRPAEYLVRLAEPQVLDDRLRPVAGRPGVPADS